MLTLIYQWVGFQAERSLKLKAFADNAGESKNLSDDREWRSQKFSTGGALISGFSSYPHNPLLICLIHYVTKYFSEK